MQVLKKRREFIQLNRRAVRIHHQGFVLQVLPATDPAQEPRFGFTVSKRVGKAVIRNRIKRRFRALCRETLKQTHWQQKLRGHDFVLIAKPETPTLSYQSLLEGVRHSLHRGLKKIAKTSSLRALPQNRAQDTEI